MSWRPMNIECIHTVALPRQEVWRLLSETNHLNHVIGFFPVDFSTVHKHSAGLYRMASAKVAGLIPLRWREYPFQWVTLEEHVVERIYESGPLARFVAGIELSDSIQDTSGDFATKPLPTSTTVRFYAQVTPQNFLGYISARLVGRKSMRKSVQYLDRQLRIQQVADTTPVPRPQTGKRPAVNTVELDRLCTQLSSAPVETEYIAFIRDLITTCDDDEVTSIRPYEFAGYLQIDKHELLRLFMYATKFGIFNLSWNMLCPNCRVSKFETSSLANVTSTFHCDFCGIQYQANFDNYVELRFSVHPHIRQATDSVYCIGGPMITPHVYVQRCIDPLQTATLHYPDTPHKLRLRVLQANHILNIDRFDASSETATGTQGTTTASEMNLTYQSTGWTLDKTNRLAPGSPIMIHNQTEETIVIDLERVQWSEDAVTAAQVTTMQEFRDLFSSEVLAPGQQVGIENVTIFFSDLRGSTALYENIGDAMAYGHVREHFELLSYWVSQNSGSLVKTIGDAVMAVFHRPHQAVRAAIDIQQHVSQFSKDIGEDIEIKIGIHTGPAIAVNSNDRLDYFGRTVNIAARVQGISVGGDIVLTEETYKFSEVQDILHGFSNHLTSFHSQLKGIEEAVSLFRLQLNRTQT